MNETRRTPKKKEAPYTVRTAKSVMDDLLVDIRARKGHPELPTGIPSLDELTWGIHKQEVQVFAARTSQGKTTMVLQVALNLASQNKKVLFISLEMTNGQVMERALCSHCSISGWDLRRGLIPSDFDEKVSTFKGIVENLDLFLVDNMGTTFDHIRTIFSSMEQAKSRPDVIVIDYINLISAGEGEDDKGAIKSYIKELKSFAKLYDIAVILVAQVNREAMKQKDSVPQLHNLKETGALEEVADTVCLLHWKRDEIDPEGTGEYRVIVAKARHGPVGVVALRFNAEQYRFEDVPIPVEAQHHSGANGAESGPTIREIVKDFTEAKHTDQTEIPF